MPKPEVHSWGIAEKIDEDSNDYGLSATLCHLKLERKASYRSCYPLVEVVLVSHWMTTITCVENNQGRRGLTGTCTVIPYGLWSLRVCVVGELEAADLMTS